MPTASSDDTFFDIEMLPANEGDALWIEYGDSTASHRVVIDCGREASADVLIERLGRTPSPRVDLLVMTHIDDDHIVGSLKLLDPKQCVELDVADVWFNGWKQINRYLSVRKAEEFSKLLVGRKLPWNEQFSNERYVHPRPVTIPRRGALPCCELEGGMKVTVLSPTIPKLEQLAKNWRVQRLELKRKKLLGGKRKPSPVEDPATLDLEELANTKLGSDTVTNGSSIAFLAEYAGKSAIFTGDAHVGVLRSSIKQLQRERDEAGELLQVDAFKVAHHGSKHAISRGLLDQLRELGCRHYLVSTNGERHYHPDREAIARVIVWGGSNPHIHFNYCTEFNSYWGDVDFQQDNGYKAFFPTGIPGLLKVSL